MKKFFSFLAAAAMLFTASCSNDDLGAEGDEAVISFSMNLNGVSSTKAIADGLKVDKLFYSVFEAKEANGDTTYTHLHTYPAVGGIQFPYNLDIRLAKGKAYRVVFWAQDADCQAYTYTNGNVTVNYVGDNNDETRDAFCGYRDVETVTGSVKLDATLKRPFAQLNVGVTADDWTAAKHSGVDITVSKVTIDKVANQIDLVNDRISGEATNLTYTYGAIPTQMLGVDLNGDKDTEDAGEQFHYLSMSYLLVEENEDVNATFTFSTAAQGGHEIALNVPVTPLQRNHRTNILGQILTGTVTFEIKIDANFDGDGNYYFTNTVFNETELRMALANADQFGGYIKLCADIELSKSLDVTKTTTLDLNGHNLTIANNSEEIGEGDVFIVQTQGVELTIEGEGTVEANTRAVWARGNDTKVIIKGGKYIGGKMNSEVIYASASVGKAAVEILGGEFEAVEKAADMGGDEPAVLNLHDGARKAGNVTMVVKGGKFKGFNPANNTSEGKNTNFVAEGYSVVESGEYYVVGKAADATTVANFTEALNNVDIVNVKNAIDNGSNVIAINNNDVIINMNGNEYKAGGQGTNNYAFNVWGSDVTINDANMNGAGLAILDGSNVTVNNSTIAAKAGKSGRNMFYVVGNSTVTVNEGTYTFERTSCYFVYVEAGCTAYINGGHWEKPLANNASKDSFVNNASTGTVIITGGTFNVDPTKWLHKDYKATKSGKIWTVSKK